MLAAFVSYDIVDVLLVGWLVGVPHNTGFIYVCYVWKNVMSCTRSLLLGMLLGHLWTMANYFL